MKKAKSKKKNLTASKLLEYMYVDFNFTHFFCNICSDMTIYKSGQSNVSKYKSKEILTVIKNRKSLCLICPIWEKIQNDKVCSDVHNVPRWIAAIESCHHPIGVSIQQFHHISLVHDIEESKVEQKDGSTWNLEEQHDKDKTAVSMPDTYNVFWL